MQPRYLFEFCDQTWVPSGARECLFEIMEACNSGLRSFNAQVADEVIAMAKAQGCTTIVELGAGRAPITSRLAEEEPVQEVTLVPCDLVPNESAYRKLTSRHGDRVQPIFSPVDITQPQPQLTSAVLVLAGIMHHIPFELRPDVLRALSQSNCKMAMFEPLRRNLLSMFLASLSIVPAALLPVTFFRRPGRRRRFLWCWLIPIVPLMFVWDGVVSCLRQWTAQEWRHHFDHLGGLAADVDIEPGFNSLRITWSGTGVADAVPRVETLRPTSPLTSDAAS